MNSNRKQNIQAECFPSDGRCHGNAYSELVEVFVSTPSTVRPPTVPRTGSNE